MTHLEMHVRVVGALILMLAAFNLYLPKRFSWGAELAKLSLLTRQIFIVHCVFVFFILLLLGSVSLFYAPLLTARTPLGTVLLFGLAAFWLLRLGIQFFFYCPSLWRGNRLHTVMHIIFSCMWVYFSAVYTTALVMAVR